MPDSRYAWIRLAVSIALSTVGGIGLWAGVVVLPFIQTEFGIDRAGASLPYTMTMIGFALGGVLMGRLADKFGIMVPMMFGAVMLEVLPLTNVVVTVKSERELREIIYLGVLLLIAVLEIVFHLLKSCKFCNKKRGARKEHEQLLFSESEQVASSVLSLKTVSEDTKNQ